MVIAGAGNTADDENGDDGYVTFPATVSGVQAVGSVTKDDNPANYTPKNDPEVDIIAPSSKYIPAPPDGDVTTMDRMNSDGYNSTNYEDSFGGTSAAARQASGVAALMLSLEAHLSESEVRQIIGDEAVDYGSSDWSGDGLLNAWLAVEEAATPAAPTNLVITNAGQVGAHPNLDWDDNSEPDLDHYNVFRCTSFYTSCSWSKIAETTTSEYTDTFVIIKEKEDANDRYDYYVSAVDTDDYESDGSNTVSTWGTQPLLRGPEEEDENPTPDAFALHAPAPNPVATQTTVQVDVPETRRVTVTVYNVMGRQVAQMAPRTMTPGFHHLSVDPDRWPSGVYFVRMTAGSFTATRRLTVVQ